MGDQNAAIRDITKLKDKDMGIDFSTNAENYNKDYQKAFKLIKNAIENI